MKREQLNILLLAGVGVGAYLIFKGGKSLFTGLAEALNIRESDTEKAGAEQYSKMPTVNAWNPNYVYQLSKLNNNAKVYWLTQADRTRLAQDIYDSIHVYLPIAPDSARILGIFAKLRYKSQISVLAGEFNRLYQKDLLTFLDNGSAMFVGNTGLSDQSMRKLLDYVNNLPTGLQK
jgi:hypothetical protein